MNYRYVLRETLTNLRRNVLMSVGAVLTMAVSLSLVGSVLLLKQGVGNATHRWRSGIEMSIFLKVDASTEQKTFVRDRLEEMRDDQEVKKYFFVDNEATLEEFQRLFRHQPEITANVRAQDLPTSYRVAPTDPEQVKRLGAEFETFAGVDSIKYADVDGLLEFTSKLQLGILIIAALLLFSAIVLILTTIQIAIFARRREIAVMKLVGATNWFIRIPFMLEGMIQGLAGAAASCGLVFVLWKFLQERALKTGGSCKPTEQSLCNLFIQLVPVGSEVMITGFWLLVIGGVVGAVGSGFAVRRFLDV